MKRIGKAKNSEKKRPVFPKACTNICLDLLNECILEEEGDREQDLSFLSNLTRIEFRTARHIRHL